MLLNTSLWNFWDVGSCERKLILRKNRNPKSFLFLGFPKHLPYTHVEIRQFIILQQTETVKIGISVLLLKKNKLYTCVSNSEAFDLIKIYCFFKHSKLTYKIQKSHLSPRDKHLQLYHKITLKQISLTYVHVLFQELLHTRRGSKRRKAGRKRVLSSLPSGIVSIHPHSLYL